MSNINNLPTTAAFNAKVNEIKNKIPNTTSLSTTTALNTADNKIPGHSKYITTSEFNRLKVKKLSARLAQANLASQNGIANFVKKTDFDDKLKSLNKKNYFKQSKTCTFWKWIKKITDILRKPFYRSRFNKDDETQLYLILQPLYYTLKGIGDTSKVASWKSKALSAEKRTTPTTTTNSFSPSVKWYNISNFCLIFKGICSKQKTQLLLLKIQ